MTTEPGNLPRLDRFSPFTRRARKVLLLSEEEAQRFGHANVEPAHLLLAILREGEGAAARILATLKISPREVRKEVERHLRPAESQVQGFIGFAPSAQAAIRFAAEEAHALGHSHIGTEHLLLGVIREMEGSGNKRLRRLGLKLDALRAEAARAPGPTLDIEVNAAPAIPRPGMEAVSCLVSNYTLDSLDLLVEAGLCATRSDAVAMLLHAGLVARSDLIAHLTEAAAQLHQWRDAPGTPYFVSRERMLPA